METLPIIILIFIGCWIFGVVWSAGCNKVFNDDDDTFKEECKKAHDESVHFVIKGRNR